MLSFANDKGLNAYFEKKQKNVWQGKWARLKSPKVIREVSVHIKVMKADFFSLTLPALS